MINFKNKKILITGATGGIGKALVKKFISLEGNVLATGTKTEKLDILKKEFSNINILKFDISDHSRIEEFIENVTSQLTGQSKEEVFKKFMQGGIPLASFGGLNLLDTGAEIGLDDKNMVA